MFQEGTKKRSWIQIVGAIVLFILVIAIIGTFVLFGIFKDANSAPSLFGYRVYIMNGDGMEPRIEGGSAVFVKEGEFPQREGNVILCSIDGQLAVVGFLGTEDIITPDGAAETRYIVKYDTAPAEEKWGVGESDIIGVAKTYSKFFGSVVKFASSKAGMLTVVIIPCALVLIYEVTMFIISLKKKKAKSPVIEEPVNEKNLKAQIEKNEKKKFVLDEGYLDKMPEESAKPAEAIAIRKAYTEAGAETAKSSFKLEFESDKTEHKPRQKLEFTSDKITIPDEEIKVEPKTEPKTDTNDDEPFVTLTIDSKDEKNDSVIDLENLSASRIDDLIKMLEAEKQRLGGDNN
ncbi:MAG: hypothetical protein IJ424_08205 [Oscillospiraceae bacterium]|nr:hypothetical protein [Oscillospiraceae bacterium]